MALSVSAQGTGTTGPYTDAKSGITFQTFTDPTGYTFGIALPETPGADFVGLLVGKAKGWAGVSLGGSMLNKLLIAAWPSGTKIVSTFRETTYVPSFSIVQKDQTNNHCPPAITEAHPKQQAPTP